MVQVAVESHTWFKKEIKVGGNPFDLLLHTLVDPEQFNGIILLYAGSLIRFWTPVILHTMAIGSVRIFYHDLMG